MPGTGPPVRARIEPSPGRLLVRRDSGEHFRGRQTVELNGVPRCCHMRRVYLLRHAKSSWKDRSLADRDWPLAARGKRAAKAVAGHVQAEGIRPDLVLCSPARRSRETLERIEAAFGDRVETRFEEALYGASEAELLARLRAVPPELDSVIIVGHNPGLEDLALALSSEGAGGRGWKRNIRPRRSPRSTCRRTIGPRSNGVAARLSPTSDLAIWIESPAASGQLVRKEHRWRLRTDTSGHGKARVCPAGGRGFRSSSAAGVSRTGILGARTRPKAAAWRRECRAEQGPCPAERDACRRTKAGRHGGAGTSKPSSPGRNMRRFSAATTSAHPPIDPTVRHWMLRATGRTLSV